MDAASAPSVAEERLRSAGLKATQARIAVFLVLNELAGHPSADEVSVAIAATGVSVSRATVFNALDDLSRAGLVMRADAGPGATRYELATAFHHHFVCKVCGTVTDVPCQESSPLCLEPEGISGRVDDAQVVFRGTCAACLANQV